jgi:hypothetical protein
LSEVYNVAFRISATPNPITFFRSINSIFFPSSISINLAGHSHRTLADVSVLFYKAVVYLRAISREVVRISSS